MVKKTFDNVKLADQARINTDQGSLYSYEYVKISKDLNFTRSMSHKGHCWENIPIENWFSQLKSERLRLIGLKSKEETIKEIKNTFSGITLNAFKKPRIFILLRIQIKRSIIFLFDLYLTEGSIWALFYFNASFTASIIA